MRIRIPNNDDILIGNRVRQARLMKGISQGDLGKKIGVTFQQVQKYEKGVNRIGGSRIIQIAEVLDQPISWFFGEPDRPAGSDIVQRLTTSPCGLALAESFLKIENNEDRHFVADLAARLAFKAPPVIVERTHRTTKAA